MAFESLWQELGQQPRTRIFHRLRQRNAAGVRGLYLWGGVGRGKTWLMDLFHDNLSGVAKGRLHFHRFMQQVHAELAQIRQQRNPLELVARRMAREWRLLCLDEFHVVDIGDAVIFAGLLKALFAQGIVLVTTSGMPLIPPSCKRNWAGPPTSRPSNTARTMRP